MKWGSARGVFVGNWLLLVAMMPALTAEGIVHVDDDAPIGGDGTSWRTAYRCLQDGLASASLQSSLEPVTIRVAYGVYRPDQSVALPDGSGNREATFTLDYGVRIVGGYAGALAADPNYRNTAANETILSGDLLANDIPVGSPGLQAQDAARLDNSRHVVVASGPASLEGVTITGGYAGPSLDDSSDHPHTGVGGGVLVTCEGVTIRDCIFRANFAVERGGGLYAEQGGIFLGHCTFDGNAAYTDAALPQGRGGAVCCINSEYAEMVNCLLVNNAAEIGGGLYSEGGRLRLTNCTAVGNWAAEGRFLADTTPRPTRGSLPPSISLDSCIVADDGNEISNSYASLTIDYTNLAGGTSAIADPQRSVVWRAGNIDADPCFADPGHWQAADPRGDHSEGSFVAGDYHLRSRAGRWDPAIQEWVQDAVTSPCIDAGNPASEFSHEPPPNGIRVNMGAYGGTEEASQSDYSWRFMSTQGPIPVEGLGIVLPHEHIFTDLRGPTSPGYGQADPQDVVRVMAPLLAEAHRKGVGVLFECSSIGVGRNPSVLAQVAQQSGLPVVIPTGVYGRDNFAPPEHRNMSEDELTELFIHELRVGIEGTGIKAGFIKIATGSGPMTPLEEKFLRAAGRAASETDAAVASHTTVGSNAAKQVAIMGSIDPAIRFIWVHAQSTSNRSLHQQMAAQGVFIEFDSLGWNPGQDSTLIAAIQDLLAAGYGDRILVSHDAGWYRPGELNGGTQKPYTYLIDTFLPKLRNVGVDEATIRMITETNPVRAFGMKHLEPNSPTEMSQ